LSSLCFVCILLLFANAAGFNVVMISAICYPYIDIEGRFVH